MVQLSWRRLESRGIEGIEKSELRRARNDDIWFCDTIVIFAANGRPFQLTELDSYPPPTTCTDYDNSFHSQ